MPIRHSTQICNCAKEAGTLDISPPPAPALIYCGAGGSGVLGLDLALSPAPLRCTGVLPCFTESGDIPNLATATKHSPSRPAASRGISPTTSWFPSTVEMDKECVAALISVLVFILYLKPTEFPIQGEKLCSTGIGQSSLADYMCWIWATILWSWVLAIRYITVSIYRPAIRCLRSVLWLVFVGYEVMMPAYLILKRFCSMFDIWI